MDVFSVISLLGGLALFLYGMKFMSSSLREGSSGALKRVIEKVTDNSFKAFLLGLIVTAIIQSSTATIVIVAGLVAAGIISLKQSIGIIVGANVGTTVTGQIIRLLDLNSTSSMVLKFFQPSTLAPIALIIGVVLIIGFNFKKSNLVANILIGFGILFTGLLNMTSAVNTFAESGVIEKLFSSLSNPFLGYLAGAAVAFALQSSSATIGILQTFSMNGGIQFSTLYPIIVGIYLGDCTTTAIVCSIGAKANAKRVGLMNIFYNLSETVLIVLVVNILHITGAIDSLWSMSMNPGRIANANTIFNLGCGIVMLPFVGFFPKLSCLVIKEKDDKKEYLKEVDMLNPVFFSTPAIAFNSAFSALKTMFKLSYENINKSIDLLYKFTDEGYKEIEKKEDDIDYLTDKVSGYLADFSSNISDKIHVKIMDQYYKDVNEFERLGDHAMNIAEFAKDISESGSSLSQSALKELEILRELINRILAYTKKAFERRDVEDAKMIEPLEEVVDDVITLLHDNHLKRLRDGKCTVQVGTCFMEILSNIERISDTCSNIGISVIIRANPKLDNNAHSYLSELHQGKDESFNEIYNTVHEEYFARLLFVNNAQ